MKTIKCMGVAFVVGVVGMFSQTQVQAGEPNAIQSRSQRDIVDGAARITKMAYVTSKSHTKIDYVKGIVYKDGSYDLTYEFSYRDNDNDPQTFTLRFEYNESGRMTDVKTVRHSSFWEPFNALKLAGALADNLAKEMNKR
jgi:hypothetical protein